MINDETTVLNRSITARFIFKGELKENQSSSWHRSKQVCEIRVNKMVKRHSNYESQIV